MSDMRLEPSGADEAQLLCSREDLPQGLAGVRSCFSRLQTLSIGRRQGPRLCSALGLLRPIW